jgi:hypothetical protein
MPVRIEEYLRGNHRLGRWNRRADGPPSGAVGGLCQRRGSNGFNRPLPGQRCLYVPLKTIPERGMGDSRPLQPVASSVWVLRRQGYVRGANVAMALNPGPSAKDPAECMAKDVANRSPSLRGSVASKIPVLWPPHRE